MSFHTYCILTYTIVYHCYAFSRDLTSLSTIFQYTSRYLPTSYWDWIFEINFSFLKQWDTENWKSSWCPPPSGTMSCWSFFYISLSLSSSLLLFSWVSFNAVNVSMTPVLFLIQSYRTGLTYSGTIWWSKINRSVVTGAINSRSWLTGLVFCSYR